MSGKDLLLLLWLDIFIDLSNGKTGGLGEKFAFPAKFILSKLSNFRL